MNDPKEKPVRVLLVVDDPALEDKYRTEVEDLGAVCDSISDVTDLSPLFSQSSYHGLLLDVPTSIRGGNRQSELLHRLMDRIPTLRILWDEATQAPRTMLSNQPLVRGVTLASFLNEHCRFITPKALRIHQRDGVYFRVWLSRQPEVDSESERTCTVDISLGGCYVVSVESWEPGQKCWVTFAEGVPLILPCEVMSVHPWEGSTDRPPGVGLRFADMNLRQQEALMARLALA